MPDISLPMIAALCLAALAAGWIDAVVGGGGLLMMPVLLLGLPDTSSAAQYALGTNKAMAIVGTTGAAVTYTRKAPVDVRLAVRIGLAAVAGSTAGAFVAAGMSTDTLKPVIMVVLLGVGAFVIFRPAFGTAPATTPVSARRVLAAIGLAGLGIGFYDGLIGPGTGTFLVLALTALLAAFNLVGGMVGARTALKKGSGFVRGVLLVVVFTLVANLAYQQWVA